MTGGAPVFSASFRTVAAPRRLVPGLLLSLGVVGAALAVAALEVRVFGHAVVEALVVALVLGMLLRFVWTPPPCFDAGIQFAAKELLEIAVFLLGAAVDVPLLMRAGPALAIGIVLLVVVGLVGGFLLSRAFGLPSKLAILVACGNAICGNSAIAAVAPVIGAKREHVASSIAFTAVLGVATVLCLPLLIGPLALNDYQYGVLAGLTVYAVPQVLAAALPVSALAGQVGTLVKLVRVLMLGPVVLFFALRGAAGRATAAGARVRIEPTRLIPWFVAGFLALAVLRAVGVFPDAWAPPVRTVSGHLTVIAMAALGLGVDMRAVGRVGRPVAAAVTASLVLLIVLAVALIRVLGVR